MGMKGALLLVTTFRCAWGVAHAYAYAHAHVNVEKRAWPPWMAGFTRPGPEGGGRP